MNNELAKPVVWGVGTSRTIRPHWTLCELGVDYESRNIIPRTASMDDPAFLQISSRGKVPILQHADLVLGESAAIVFYLAQRYRDRLELIPESGTVARARFDEMSFFIMTELDGPLYVMRRHAGLPEIYGASQTAVDAARQYFLRQCTVVENWLEAEGPYLMGRDFSAADILLGSCQGWARFNEIELPAKLAEHQAIVTGRTAFKQAFANNFPPAAMAELTPDEG